MRVSTRCRRAATWNVGSGIPPVRAGRTGDPFQSGQSLIRRTCARQQQSLDVLDQSGLLGVGRLVHGEISDAQRRDVDGVDPGDDQRAVLRNVAGARDPAGKPARDAERQVVRRRIERDPVADAIDLLREACECVAIDVGRDEDDLVNARRAGRRLPEIGEDAQQRFASDAVRNQTDARGAGSMTAKLTNSRRYCSA